MFMSEVLIPHKKPRIQYSFHEEKKYDIMAKFIDFQLLKQVS